MGKVRALGILALCLAAGVQAGEVPAPPQQDAPWKAKAAALPDVSDALDALFKLGIADPRGCEYRAIRPAGWKPVRWDGEKPPDPHGWVIPAVADAKQRFAVCWDGLVYPLDSVGAPADLRKDIEALTAEGQEAKKHSCEPEPFSHETMSPIKAVLLLRLGEDDLAGKVWARYVAEQHDIGNAAGPYLDLAVEWVTGLYKRAWEAHIAGDDPLALQSLRTLERARKTVDAEAGKRWFERPERDDKPVPYLDEYLNGFDALLADQERRAKELKRESALDMLLKLPDAKTRVQALIRDLDRISIRGQLDGLGWPMDADFKESPIYQALIKQGDAAVDPLLDCLEQDTRLTRSDHSHEMHPVTDAARRALSAILRLDFNAATPQFAETVRNYWSRVKALPQEERLFMLLADDQYPAELHVAAALDIVYPWVERGSTYECQTYGRPRVADAMPNPAEPLRKKTNPSVADLIATRMMQAVRETEEKDGQHDWNVRASRALAEALMDWDRKPHPAEMRALTAELQKEFAVKIREYEHLPAIVGLYDRRIDLGDGAALAEYCDWVKTVRVASVLERAPLLFQPMILHPADPAAARAAERAFEDEDSTWVKFLNERPISRAQMTLFGSSLVVVPAFRKRIVQELGDKEVIAAAIVDKDGSLNYFSGSNPGVGVNIEDPRAPKAGTEIRVRVCDQIAFDLSKIRGFPRFELYWPEAERDKAIAGIVAALEKFGPILSAEPVGEEWLFGPPAHLKFPDLGRPATPDDVAQLRAIFTLAGKGETRTVRLRERPLRVSWVALKDKPVRYLASRADTGETVPGELTWDQDGWVWQAEELLKDGKWQRWYGFVGPHALAKVPAEEVRLPGGPLTKEGFAANLDMAGLTDRQSGAVLPEALAKLLPGMPVRAVCRITNCSGIDRAAPAEFYRKDPRTGPALLAGFDVKVLYVLPEKAEDSGVEDLVFCETPETEIGENLPWQRLPCKVTARFRAEGPGRVLAMGEEFKTGEIDLTELFDLTRPGLYAVQFVFTAKDGAFADGISDCIVFRLPGPKPQATP